MPKVSKQKLQLQFQTKVNERVKILEQYFAQIRRALEFAKDGNISDSFNILSTFGNVFDGEAVAADFVPGSDFLFELQKVRNDYLDLEL